MKKKLNIALFSPNKNPYSETFIQAHKNFLRGNVFYYYGIGENIALEKYPPLVKQFKRYILKAIKIILKKDNSFLLEQILTKSLKKNDIDVVLVEYGIHAHHILPAIEKTKLPLIVHFHGFDATVREIIKEHNNYKEVFKYASKVIAVSRAMEQQLLDLGCSRDKLVYNANAAQVEFQELKPKFSKEQFVFVGRFTNKKAPYYAILAFKNVLKKYPKAKLFMCGDGPLFEMCKNLVKHYKLENSVIFLGVISSKELRKLLSESLGYIQHSITASNGDMEGMPISVLEASAAGLPVVSTYHAGISDVIEHGVTGLLSEEHDVLNMEQNLIKLLDNVEYARKLGLAGKERVKSYFSLDRHINGIQHLLESSVKVEKG